MNYLVQCHNMCVCVQIFQAIPCKKVHKAGEYIYTPTTLSSPI